MRLGGGILSKKLMKCEIIFFFIFAFHYFDDLQVEMKINTEAEK